MNNSKTGCCDTSTGGLALHLFSLQLPHFLMLQLNILLKLLQLCWVRWPGLLNLRDLTQQCCDLQQAAA